MATITEQPKPPAAQDHPYPPNVVPYPQPYSPPFPPPPPGYPPFFAYPPPADPAHPESGQTPVPPAPYMMAFAPSGMVYAYPPPQGAGQSLITCLYNHQLNCLAFPPPASSVPPALAKPKRKQVKMAVCCITSFLTALYLSFFFFNLVYKLRCCLQAMR